MGLLRFLLAVCVVATHTGPLFGMKWMEGLNAVVVFFIISGFYMSLILNEKYTGDKSSYGLFISNRLLRLIPLYWTVLLAHFILCWIGFTWKNDALALQIYIDHLHEITTSGWIVFISCNLFVLGQDTLYYLHLIPYQGLIWSTSEGIPTTWFMLMLPAWTLSIELMFYFMAPLFLRKQRRIIILTILLLLIAVYCYFAGIDLGSLTKTQFAPYLIYFLLGAIAWLIYKKVKIKGVMHKKCKIIFGFYLICLMLYPYLYPESSWQIQLFYGLSFLSLPFIFELTKNWKWDIIIGEYSYPIYITHMMAIDLLKLFEVDKREYATLTFLVTLAISFLLIKLVAQPIEQLRLKRFYKSIISN